MNLVKGNKIIICILFFFFSFQIELLQAEKEQVISDKENNLEIASDIDVKGDMSADSELAEEVEEEDEEEDGLLGMSIEELLDVEIISVTRRKGQDLFTAPAAVYVISQEDIRRAGHLSLSEQLRMSPGLHVAKIDQNVSAITARGQNGQYGNMLLVQQDGRTIYSPLFSGVFWEAQGIVLQDVDRIEIVRGPGATLWGANAVNGIISIVTKPAKETQGWLVSSGVGTEMRGYGTVRYGGILDEGTYFKVYGKHIEWILHQFC